MASRSVILNTPRLVGLHRLAWPCSVVRASLAAAEPRTLPCLWRLCGNHSGSLISWVKPISLFLSVSNFTIYFGPIGFCCISVFFEPVPQFGFRDDVLAAKMNNYDMPFVSGDRNCRDCPLFISIGVAKPSRSTSSAAIFRDTINSFPSVAQASVNKTQAHQGQSARKTKTIRSTITSRTHLPYPPDL